MKTAIIAAVVAALVSSSASVAATRYINGRSISPHSIPLNRLASAPVGLKETQGLTGSATTFTKELQTVSVGSGYASPSVSCPSGSRAISGGFLARPPLTVMASMPAQDLSDWELWVYNNGNQNAVVTVYVICAS